MRFTFLVLALVSVLSCMADITGQIVDSTDRSPVIGASVAALSGDSIFLAAVTTDTDGKFVIAGDFKRVRHLRITGVGYDSLLIKDIKANDLGVISLNPKSHRLGAVTVTAEARPQTATTETIFLTDSIRALASNAALMLGKLPGIKVDWFTEDVSVGNDLNVPIIVNGRKVGMQYAKSINPKRIKSIEIQHYPPGEYADIPTLINLVLFDSYVGWDVATNLTATARMLNKHSNSESAATDLTFSSRNWTTYLSAQYKRVQKYDGSAFKREIEGVSVEESAPININHPNIRENADRYSLSAGVDRKLGQNHILSFQTWLDGDYTERKERYELLPAGDQLNTDRYNSLNSVTGLFYRGKFMKKLSVWSSLSYNYYDINEKRRFVEAQLNSDTHTLGRKDYTYFHAMARYEISDRWEATVAYNNTWRKYRNREAESQEMFTSYENRNKASATVTFSPSNTLSLLAGIEMLSISNRQNGARDSHTSWLPKLQGYWKPFRQARLTLIYFNEVFFPNLDMLSPVSWNISANMIQTGNPALKSRTMHYAQADLTIFDFLTFHYIYRMSNNDIIDWYEMAAPDKVKRTYINCDYLYQYIGFTIDKNLGKDFNIYYHANWQPYKRSTGDISSHGRTLYSDLSGTWTMANNLSLMCGFFLRHDKEPLPQGIRYGQDDTLVFGASYPFLKGKMPVSVQIAFPTNLISKQTYTKIDIPGYKSVLYGDDRLNTCLFRINIRYNIGKGKVTKQRNAVVTDSEK